LVCSDCAEQAAIILFPQFENFFLIRRGRRRVAIADRTLATRICRITQLAAPPAMGRCPELTR
jgi:hypothetical protein